MTARTVPTSRPSSPATEKPTTVPATVRVATNAPEAAAVGAAALVLQSELAPRHSGVRLPPEVAGEVSAQELATLA